MAKLYTMVGLPGSGKSTFSALHPECVVIASDAIREELYGDESTQGNPVEVFKVVYERIGEELAKGNDVIYDATNTVAKFRKQIINTFEAEHICVFVNTPKDECLRRNAQRARFVPVEVIERMARQFEAPTLNEGFVKILEV